MASGKGGPSSLRLPYDRRRRARSRVPSLVLPTRRGTQATTGNQATAARGWSAPNSLSSQRVRTTGHRRRRVGGDIGGIGPRRPTDRNGLHASLPQLHRIPPQGGISQATLSLVNRPQSACVVAREGPPVAFRLDAAHFAGKKRLENPQNGRWQSAAAESSASTDWSSRVNPAGDEPVRHTVTSAVQTTWWGM